MTLQTSFSPAPPPGLSVGDCQRLVTSLLLGPMVEDLRGVEYDLPAWERGASDHAIPEGPTMARCSRARVLVRHLPGSSDAVYRLEAFGETLEMRLQLNVWRFVLVYSLPGGGLVDVDGLAGRFARWQRGAEHAGWTLGWRDAVDPWDHTRALVEVYCYAMLPRDFLVDPMAQLYWRTDIVQMTRAFFLEAKRAGVTLTAGEPEAVSGA